MPHSPPLVSVIIPTYNRGSLINETIISVTQQTYKNYELIIIDDASTDKTADWIAENYPEFQLIRLDNNVGNAAARNIALRKAKGDLIAFLDHDDQWSSNYLQVQVNALQNAPQAILSYCNYFEVKEDGSQCLHNLKPKNIYPDFTYHLLMHNIIHSFSLTVIKKSALFEVGLLNESFQISNDFELYLRLSLVGKIIHIPEALVFKYIHGNNLGRKHWLWYQETLKMYDLFFEQDFSQAYRHLQNQIKCHAMVALFKSVWAIKKDIWFAIVVQTKALMFAPIHRFFLLSQRWQKILYKLKLIH